MNNLSEIMEQFSQVEEISLIMPYIIDIGNEFQTKEISTNIIKVVYIKICT